MSTIKSSAENLTLNADGANNDIKFQSNGSEVASIDQAGSLVLSGNLTSVGIDDNANALAMTINSSENVGIGTASPDNRLTIKGTSHQGLNIRCADGYNATLSLSDTSGSAYESYVRYHTDTNNMSFAVNGAERMRILAAGGLTFNGDTAAANALDDYEEGDWTPTCSTATISSINRARYTKIGRVVHVFTYIILANDGTSAATLIGGLPFQVGNQVYETGIIQAGSNSGSRAIISRAESNDTTIYFTYADGAQADVPTTVVDNGHIMISLKYTID